MKAVVANTC